MVDLYKMRKFDFGVGLGAGTAEAGRLSDIGDFGDNPGALQGKVYIPATLRAGEPLVVALHGCTQDAAVYDRGTGWSTLAEREGFALLLPEQTRANNANGCFNWFAPGDIARLGGEAESIAAMTRHVVARHGLDPARVHVTGLSAGGAMTAVMLATYPELFAGGAIIGGLAYGCASGVAEALRHMRSHPAGSDRLVDAVTRAAGGHGGRWPTVAIWHGGADATVNLSNLHALERQWRGVHQIGDAPDTNERGAGWEHRSWRAADGRVAVETWVIPAMGHGVPVDPHGADGLGASGPYMLDVGLSSTAEIARSWNLIAPGSRGLDEPIVAPRLHPAPATSAEPGPAPATAPPPTNDVGSVIDKALRAAGLMR